MPPAGLGHFPRALTSRAPPGHHPDSREGRGWEHPSPVLTSPPVPTVRARAAAGRTCPAQRGHGTQTALGKGLWCPALLSPPSLGVQPTVHTRYVHGDPAGPGPRRHACGPDAASQRSWAMGGAARGEVRSRGPGRQRLQAGPGRGWVAGRAPGTTKQGGSRGRTPTRAGRRQRVSWTVKVREASGSGGDPPQGAATTPGKPMETAQSRPPGVGSRPGCGQGARGG